MARGDRWSPPAPAPLSPARAAPSPLITWHTALSHCTGPVISAEPRTFFLADSKACYLESGTTGCATGYLPFYTGHLYGGHSGHGGVNNRICVDKDVGSGEYTYNQGTNGHLYPTVERSQVGARSRNPSAVLCYQCCKV